MTAQQGQAANAQSVNEATTSGAAAGSEQGQANGNAAASENDGNQQQAQAGTFDIKDLPKEAWDAIYQSGRFKELNQKAKQADVLLKEKQDAEQKALEEQGKWQEIAQKKEAEVQSWSQRVVGSELKAFAAKYGAHDITDVAALADKSQVKVDDDGNVVGAEEAVKALLESKPHLFNNSNQQPPRVGSGTNPGDPSNQGTPKFTRSQLQDHAFYMEHEAEILQALKTGNVVDDVK